MKIHGNVIVGQSLAKDKVKLMNKPFSHCFKSDQFVVLDVQPVMNTDALQTSRPIIVDVETPDDINQQFDTISYNKVYIPTLIKIVIF